MSPCLRPAGPADFPALAAVYRDAVRTLGPQAYSSEQVAVWARYGDDPDLRARLSRGVVVLVEIGADVAAFGQLDPADHVAFMYCCGRYSRRGLASQLAVDLEKRAAQAGARTLTTDASRISRPFFERHGFVVLHAEYPVRSGLTFERFRMEKRLGVPKLTDG